MSISSSTQGGQLTPDPESDDDWNSDDGDMSSSFSRVPPRAPSSSASSVGVGAVASPRAVVVKRRRKGSGVGVGRREAVGSPRVGREKERGMKGRRISDRGKEKESEKEREMVYPLTPRRERERERGRGDVKSPSSAPPPPPPYARHISDESSQPPSSEFTPPVLRDLQSAASYGLSFLREITSNIFFLLRKPLAWVITLYLLAICVSYLYSFLRGAIFSALSPLCLLPGTDHLPFCLPTPSSPTANPPWSVPAEGINPHFPGLMELQGQFGSVLEESGGAGVMALDLKNSEMAIRDLNTLIKASSLTCREDLSNRLEEFITEAKGTSKALTRFSSRVNGVVDNLLAMDEYALKTLEQIVAQEEAARNPPLLSSNSALLTYPRALVATLLSPFRTDNSGLGLTSPRHQFLETFLHASSLLSTSLRHLILTAESTLRSLDSLETRLTTIADLLSHESASIQTTESEILGSIWTFLGGNRAKLEGLRGHAELLRRVGGYRRAAGGHVARSLLGLQGIQGGLEELRERVVGPVVVAGGKSWPDGDEEGGGWGGLEGEGRLEVHVESVRRGVERLREGMERAKGRENDHVMRLMGVQEESVRRQEEGLRRTFGGGGAAGPGQVGGSYHGAVV